MTDDLMQAITILDSGDYTCVLCREGIMHTSTARGVRPLLDWLDSGLPFAGFSAADRVVGKATAMLYCLLGVKEVYARVMSRSAAQVLQSHGIAAHFQSQAEFIQNRTKTGRCPMEQAVWELDDPEAGLAAVRLTLQRLQSQTT